MAKRTTPHIILASASIGRKSLLEKLGFPFSVLPSTIDEESILHANPVKMIETRAEAKAENVVNQLPSSSTSYQLQANSYLIIAADSMAIIGNKSYGKVKNKLEAMQMVRDLMGKTHEFVTATQVILWDKKIAKRWKNTSITKVTLRTLTDQEIHQYTSLYNFEKFAACYSLEVTPWDWVVKIDGSYTSVIGLPFEVLLPILREVKILS